MVKSFGFDDEVIVTFREYLTDLYLEAFSEGIRRLHDCKASCGG